MTDYIGVLAALAKAATALGLYAWLLRRGGLRPGAVAVVCSAHLVGLTCVLPGGPEVIFAVALILGTLSYAMLVVEHWEAKAVWVVVAVAALAFLMQGMPPAAFVAACIPVMLWTGGMAAIRDWARGETVR